jgi:hypothetical protein
MKLISTIILFLFCFDAHAQSSKDTVKAGLYIENIYDLSFSDQSFKADYWIWFNYKNDSIDLPNNIEIIKNKNITTELQYKGKYKDTIWGEKKLKVELVKKWDIRNFPFDKQRLFIETEVIDGDTSEECIVLDSLKSGIDSSIKISDWKITGFKFFKKINKYSTNFGDPSEMRNVFYSIVAEVDIERNVMGLFFKLFIGVFIAAIIALSSLCIPAAYTDPRYGLPVGALFAAVGNKYIVDNIIPQTSYITLVDKIHFLTFSLIMLIIIVSIISQKESINGNIKLSKRIDLISFWILLFSYLFVVLLSIIF